MTVCDSGVPTKILYAFLVSPIRVMHLAHPSCRALAVGYYINLLILVSWIVTSYGFVGTPDTNVSEEHTASSLHGVTTHKTTVSRNNDAFKLWLSPLRNCQIFS